MEKIREGKDEGWKNERKDCNLPSAELGCLEPEEVNKCGS
jgi:hypothetical protein